MESKALDAAAAARMEFRRRRDSELLEAARQVGREGRGEGKGGFDKRVVAGGQVCGEERASARVATSRGQPGAHWSTDTQQHPSE